MCAWIDADHTGSVKTGGLQLHLRMYRTRREVEGPASASSELCREPALVTRYKPDWPRYGVWSSTSPRTRDTGRELASRAPVPSPFNDTLITSRLEQHSAKELCAWEASYGPSFVSLQEGTYCDMGTRAVWPLCTEKEGDVGCYDLKTRTLVESKVSKRHMGHSNLIEW